MNSRDKEKQRLWKDVMETKRPWQKDSSITLKDEKTAQTQLNEILNRKQESLDVDQLSKDLEKDYGVKEEPVEKTFDEEKVFAQTEENVNALVPGQKKAVHDFCLALRRPYITGYEKGQARNVIVMLGPKGAGKQEIMNAAFDELYKRQIVISRNVWRIDLSRYSAPLQEQVFLQDLYEAFASDSPAVCFEDLNECFSSFARMLSSLVIDGKMLLSRRYVSSKGMLVENQSGLVKNAVDHLSASDKYLIFVSEGKISDVQDVFGASFLRHVPDVIVLNRLNEDAVRKIIAREKEQWIHDCQKKLNLEITVDESVSEWVFAHYEKDEGWNSIRELFHEFEDACGQVVLQEGIKDQKASVRVKDDVPVMEVHGKEWNLIHENDRRAEMDEVNAELDAIVGLKEVKDYIHSLQANVLVQQKRKEQGLKSSPVSMHMIFTGNPGTGKTTIARLFARYMKAAGVLSQGQLVEVTRSDLVAKYVGQTAPLTMSVIHSALGGVLFIDEAYSLYRGKDDSFGLECIDTLVKAMEDYRDNLIVILAGYQKEMSAFLEANSGLKSRFPHIIAFPDYTGEELVQIAQLQAKAKGYVIDESALKPMQAYFDAVQKDHASEAGNGRLARNTVEAAVLKQSERLIHNPDEDLSLLKEEDFDFGAS